METQLNSKAAEPSNIIECILHTQEKDLDIKPGVVEIYYYQSVLDCTVRVTLTVTDTGYRYRDSDNSSILDSTKLKTTVGEFVSLKFEDNQGNGVSFSKDTNNPLMVKEIYGFGADVSKEVFKIDLWSEEATYNNLKGAKVVGSYNDKPSNIVEEILRKNLKTQKSLDIEKTQNNLRYIGNKQKPFYSCVELASKSTPSQGKTPGILAGFFFYETSVGYKFKSIDTLLSQPSVRKYIANETTKLPPQYDGKIYHYNFSSNYDLENILMLGSFTDTALTTIDPVTEEVIVQTFDHTSQNLRSNNAGNEFPEISSGWKIKNESASYTVVKDNGSLPQGRTVQEQLNRSLDQNFNPEQVVRQSRSRYNQLYSNRLTLTIAGDIGLNVGDMIHCGFAEITSDKSNISESPTRSGLYMITELCHRLTTDGTWSRLQCVRDSFGRKPI